MELLYIIYININIFHIYNILYINIYNIYMKCCAISLDFAIPFYIKCSRPSQKVIVKLRQKLQRTEQG